MDLLNGLDIDTVQMSRYKPVAAVSQASERVEEESESELELELSQSKEGAQYSPLFNFKLNLSKIEDRLNGTTHNEADDKEDTIEETQLVETQYLDTQVVGTELDETPVFKTQIDEVVERRKISIPNDTEESNHSQMKPTGFGFSKQSLVPVGSLVPSRSNDDEMHEQHSEKGLETLQTQPASNSLTATLVDNPAYVNLSKEDKIKFRLSLKPTSDSTLDEFVDSHELGNLRRSILELQSKQNKEEESGHTDEDDEDGQVKNDEELLSEDDLQNIVSKNKSIIKEKKQSKFTALKLLEEFENDDNLEEISAQCIKSSPIRIDSTPITSPMKVREPIKSPFQFQNHQTLSNPLQQYTVKLNETIRTDDIGAKLIDLSSDEDDYNFQKVKAETSKATVLQVKAKFARKKNRQGGGKRLEGPFVNKFPVRDLIRHVKESNKSRNKKLFKLLKNKTKQQMLLYLKENKQEEGIVYKLTQEDKDLEDLLTRELEMNRKLKERERSISKKSQKGDTPDSEEVPDSASEVEAEEEAEAEDIAEETGAINQTDDPQEDNEDEIYLGAYGGPHEGPLPASMHQNNVDTQISINIESTQKHSQDQPNFMNHVGYNKEIIETDQLQLDSSTQLISESQSPSIPKTEIVLHSSSDEDEEEDEDEAESRRIQVDLMKMKIRKKELLRKKRDREMKSKKLDQIMQQEAEESEDEYHGMGGIDGDFDDEANSEDEEMLDDYSKIKQREDKLQSLLAKTTIEEDREQIKRLLHDIQTGRLRRGRGNQDDLELSEGEDDLLMQFYRNRREKQRERLKQELESANSFHNNKKARAFFETISDVPIRVSSVELEQLVDDDEEGEDQEGDEQEHNELKDTQCIEKEAESDQFDDDDEEPIKVSKRGCKRKVTEAFVQKQLSFLREVDDEDECISTQTQVIAEEDVEDEMEILKSRARFRMSRAETLLAEEEARAICKKTQEEDSDQEELFGSLSRKQSAVGSFKSFSNSMQSASDGILGQQIKNVESSRTNIGSAKASVTYIAKKAKINTLEIKYKVNQIDRTLKAARKNKDRKLTALFNRNRGFE
ncbi:BA75_01206T0 [Komagataella pastoris]|uniref:BA75_01206T0 n=1 Tax=Komagataella pastoris TaxID=4922 RepID=A0A1B2J8B1_PICPA|nr:BA75_01206T0 [Komagataella pastoris]